jgi:hypothetical protein
MKTISAIILLLLCPAWLLSQSTDDKNELSVWGGYSPGSNTSLRFLGRTPDAKFGILALRYARRFSETDNLTLRYTADLIPVSALTYPDTEVSGGVRRNVRPTRYAWGISPLGLQLSFRPHKKVQPFVDATGGMLFYSRATPNIVGTKLNFTFHFGGGIDIATGGNRAITIGYKYFHISNANRGTSNPGFDNNVIYVGYRFHTW